MSSKQPDQPVGAERRWCSECNRMYKVGTSKGHAISCSVGNSAAKPPTTDTPDPAADCVAKEIINDHIRPCAECFGDALPDVQRAITKIVAAALTARDERAAGIAEQIEAASGKIADEAWREGDKVSAYLRQGWCAGAGAIAAAIRDTRSKEIPDGK